MSWFIISVLIGFAFWVQSCREVDDVPPSIRITSPFEGALYSVFDTVVTSFEAEDETQIVELTAELVNSDFIPITPKTTLESKVGTAALVIQNKALETGDYYVLITAKDGINESREFRKIKIVAIPKVMRAVYAATSSGSGQEAIFKIDSLFGQTSLWTQLNQDVLKMCVNSLSDKLTIVGKFSTGLKSYSINSSSLDWNDEAFSVAQTQRFMDVFCFENTVFTTFYDREIRSYSEAGSLTLNVPTGEYRPEEIYADGKYILVDMNLVGDVRNTLFVYNYLTRARVWQTEFQVDIVSICPLQDDQVLVFGNSDGQGKVFEYDIGLNTWWEPRQLPEGEVRKAVHTESGRFAILHENGLYTYTYSPNFLNQIDPREFQDIGYELDNGTLLAASGNTLYQLTETGQTINSIALSDPIVSFDIHYTR